jgi:hypothetical protein
MAQVGDKWRKLRHKVCMSRDDDKAAARGYLARLNWTVRGVAEIVGVPETRIRRMLTGHAPMDRNVLDWLRVLSEFHAENPPPRLDPTIPAKTGRLVQDFSAKKRGG